MVLVEARARYLDSRADSDKRTYPSCLCYLISLQLALALILTLILNKPSNRDTGSPKTFSRPKHNMAGPAALVVPALKKHTATVIMAHGLGDR